MWFLVERSAAATCWLAVGLLEKVGIVSVCGRIKCTPRHTISLVSVCRVLHSMGFGQADKEAAGVCGGGCQVLVSGELQSRQWIVRSSCHSLSRCVR